MKKPLPFPTSEELDAIEIEESEDLMDESFNIYGYYDEFEEDEDEYVLDYFADGDLEDLIASDALDEFSLDEILAMNDVPEAEILAVLYRDGLIGVPVAVSELELDDEEIEEIPFSETEEDE